MTLIIVAFAVALALFVARKAVSDARSVGYPESARTTSGAFRLAMITGMATFAIIVGPWMAIAEA